MASQWYAIVVEDTAAADERWPRTAPHASGQAVSFASRVSHHLLPACVRAVPIDHQPGSGERWDSATRLVVTVDE